MAKLIRCEAGHVFDSQAHKACPECARLGIVHHTEPAIPAKDQTKPASSTRHLVTVAGLAIPLSWPAVGGAAAVALTVGVVALRSPGPELPQSTPPQNAIHDVQPLQPAAPAVPPLPRPQAAVPPSTPPPPPPPAIPENHALAQRLPGVYRIDGRNPNGRRYGGKVLITAAETAVFNFLWRISSGETYRGRGRLQGDILTVDWGQQYPVIYRVGDDGVLRGRWDNGRGIETLVLD